MVETTAPVREEPAPITTPPSGSMDRVEKPSAGKDNISAPHLPAFPQLTPQLGEPLDEELSEKQVDQLLRRMTRRQKIGQRLMFRIDGTKIDGQIEKLIVEGYVGGIILTSQNIKSREQVRTLTKELQILSRSNDPPLELFIGIDQEGGRVNRLVLDHPITFPPPFYWSRYADPFLIEAIAYITGREIRDLGCNMNFAPVLDLYPQADDSVIGDRSMGSDPQEVGIQGVYYIHGARRAGVIPVVKHFPGHGSTVEDSHYSLPVVDKDEQTLFQEDLYPFQMAIDYSVDVIMTAHLLFPELDSNYPATLSREIIDGLLRNRLGFNGVVISDDIGMQALTRNFDLDEILEACYRAGVDLVLSMGSGDQMALIDRVEKLYDTGRLSPVDLDESVRRILRLKLKWGLID